MSDGKLTLLNVRPKKSSAPDFFSFVFGLNIALTASLMFSWACNLFFSCSASFSCTDLARDAGVLTVGVARGAGDDEEIRADFGGGSSVAGDPVSLLAFVLLSAFLFFDDFAAAREVRRSSRRTS